MKNYSTIIWDFNGTLLDDVDACIRSANRLLANHHLPPLTSPDQYRSIFGFPIENYYRRLGFDFTLTPFADLAIEWVNYYAEFSKDSKLYEGIPDLLEKIRQKGIPQIILSATQKSMLEEQTKSLKINTFFTELLGLDNIHAKSKEAIALSWRKRHPDETLLFLGDTDHDAQVAKAIHADCILFASGHQSKSYLQTLSPLAVYNEPKDLEL